MSLDDLIDGHLFGGIQRKDVVTSHLHDDMGHPVLVADVAVKPGQRVGAERIMKDPATGDPFVQYCPSSDSRAATSAAGRAGPSSGCWRPLWTANRPRSSRRTPQSPRSGWTPSPPRRQPEPGERRRRRITGIAALAVKSPAGEMYMVCRASKCQLAGPVFPGTKILTARLLSGGTSRSSGSLSTGAPGGMVMDGWPPKVSVRSDTGRSRLPQIARCNVRRSRR